MNEKCQYCKRLLDDPNDPTTRDCGGDCLRCMGEIFEDPDCVIALLTIRIEAQAAEIEHLRAEAEAHYDRGYYDGSTHPIVRHDALREALKRIEVATRNEVRAGDKGYVSRYGINGIARAALDQSK